MQPQSFRRSVLFATSETSGVVFAHFRGFRLEILIETSGEVHWRDFLILRSLEIWHDFYVFLCKLGGDTVQF